MRIIARLDVKPPYVVKPIKFEGLKKIAPIQDLIDRYYGEGADEIFYIDIVASLYQRKILFNYLNKSTAKLYIPFSVGGGVQSIDDCEKLLHSGADKIIINTYALQNNASIIDKFSKTFGSQAVSVHIEAKRWNHNLNYECYSDCGRIRSYKDVLLWSKEVEGRGAGEVVLSVIDNDGMQNGFDLDISKNVIDSVNIPVVIGSGAGNINHILEVASLNPSGIALGSILHYRRSTIAEIKRALLKSGVEVFT